MKISIIGSNGFLSTSIGKYFSKKDYILEVYGRKEPICYSFSRFKEIDLVKSELDYNSLLDSDIIIYASGAGIQSNLNEDSDTIYNLNVTIPIKLFTHLNELNYKGTIITFGSVFEIGETDVTKFFSEDDIENSICPAPNNYTVSKRLLTKFISSYKVNFRYWHFIIPTIYGPGENPKRLIPYTISCIEKNEMPHFTSGEQTRQYLFVDEVPEIIATAYLKGLNSGVYNLEGGETLTVKDIVTRIFQHFNRNIYESCFGITNRIDTKMKYLALNGSKLNSSIGYKSKVRIEEILDKYLSNL